MPKKHFSIYNCFYMETWCTQFKSNVVFIKCKNYHFPSENLWCWGEDCPLYLAIPGEIWICTSKWFSLDDFTPTVLHHSPLTFLWQTIPMKSSNSEGGVRQVFHENKQSRNEKCGVCVPNMSCSHQDASKFIFLEILWFPSVKRVWFQERAHCSKVWKAWFQFHLAEGGRWLGL